MKVFGNRVLIEQKKVIKVSSVFLPGGKKAENETSVTFQVIGVGSKVEEAQIGDVPIFGKHVVFHGVKVIDKTETSETLHVIVFEDDILGADDSVPTPVVIEETTAIVE